MSADPPPNENEGSDNNLKIPADYFKDAQPQKPPLVLKPAIQPDEKPTGNFYSDLEIFFKQLSRSFEGRYALWENTFVSIMNMLREIRKSTEKNTEIAIEAIKELEKRILKGLEQFKLKRDEIERYSGLEIKQISQKFKKTLDILRMQIREYVLEREVKELYELYDR